MGELIKKGFGGNEVMVLQIALQTLGYYSNDTDGIFGPYTEECVRKFQSDSGLVVDGIVGALTWKALSARGKVPDDAIIPNPAFKPKRPRNYEDVRSIFGNYSDDATRGVWESQNLTFCQVPDEFTCFPKRGGFPGFTTNKNLVTTFKDVFWKILNEGLADKIYSYDGCYNPRRIQGSSSPSLHSWAIAIDLNYEGNELGDPTPSMDQQVVDIFKAAGFFWGGDFQHRKDGMHFEWFDRS